MSAERPFLGSSRGWAVVAVWLATAVGVAVVVAVVRGSDVFAWLALALALAVVAGFVGQLVVGEQRGFTLRLAASAGGALLVVLIGAAAALATR